MIRKALCSCLLVCVAHHAVASKNSTYPYNVLFDDYDAQLKEQKEQRHGFLYPKGERFTDDNDLKNSLIAMRWFAVAGDVESQSAMGDLFAKGIYEPHNLETAVYWYELAAKYGNLYAQYLMGICYQQGWLGKVDADRAYEYFSLANMNDDKARGQRQIAQFFGDKDSAMYDLAESFRWYEYAAQNGDVDAQLKLADWYYHGDGVAKDIMKALKWYGKAAAQSDPYAQYSVALIYLHGDKDIPIDYTQAVEWLQKAAHQGFSAAQYTLGRLYYTGRGVVHSNVLAYAWLKLASKQHNPAVEQDIARIMRKMSMDEIEQAVKLSDYYETQMG